MGLIGNTDQHLYKTRKSSQSLEILIGWRGRFIITKYKVYNYLFLHSLLSVISCWITEPAPSSHGLPILYYLCLDSYYSQLHVLDLSVLWILLYSVPVTHSFIFIFTLASLNLVKVFLAVTLDRT